MMPDSNQKKGRDRLKAIFGRTGSSAASAESRLDLELWGGGIATQSLLHKRPAAFEIVIDWNVTRPRSLKHGKEDGSIRGQATGCGSASGGSV